MVNPMYGQRISTEQAVQIALQQVSGEVMHIDLDMENGLLVYEVFILTPPNTIYEVEVNAKTGKIVKIEQENDFD
ncbi:PepSY domain-containing protein [Bacillus sp. FJAT-22090]|uniref:PepSY domain-containing protein n=1 Tax=Bacillus sp. FJAT-22090 TaxID=1581038 RepID=UPI0011AA14EE|nr:PepSY domain-containing protein [Bacillus sp. FJAT-22090]